MIRPVQAMGFSDSNPHLYSYPELSKYELCTVAISCGLITCYQIVISSLAFCCFLRTSGVVTLSKITYSRF